MPPSSIADVITELDGIVAWSRREDHRAGYFAVLYRDVTRRVAAGIAAGRFEDGARMERLDVLFARRYLDAFHSYRNSVPTTRSWDVAFRGAESWSPLILQHLLLGINAHINLDLGIAAAETSPGAELQGLQRDFDEITVLLGEMLDEVQDRISLVSPWMWFLDKVGARTDEEVFSFVLKKARAFAWRSATTLAAGEKVARNLHIGLADEAVALLGMGVRNPGWLLRPVLLTVRMREPYHAAEVIDALAG